MSRNQFAGASLPPISSGKSLSLDFSKTTTKAATDSQVSFLRRLMAEREWDSKALAGKAWMVESSLESNTEWLISGSSASAAINYLKSCSVKS